MANSEQIDLLLIGKTGTGKSATGNSILRHEAFISVCGPTSVTSEIQYEVSEFNDRIIKVVDGPGVGDTRLDSDDAIRLMIDKMTYAIAVNPNGYHAFLLLVKFSDRFTAEDQHTVDFLKKIFGQDFVKNFCILLVTCGDDFEYHSKKTGIEFPQWCKQQGGQLGSLIKECNNRVVLFDNRTEDKEKKNKQIEHLLNVVDTMASQGCRYSDGNFERASKERHKIMIELKKAVIEEETMNETSLILFKIGELREHADLLKRVGELTKLEVRVETLLKSLSTQDQGSGVLHDLYLNVESIKRNILEEEKMCYRMIKEREDVRRRETELKGEFNKIVQELESRHKQEQKAMKKRHQETETIYADLKRKNDRTIVDKIVSAASEDIRTTMLVLLGVVGVVGAVVGAAVVVGVALPIGVVAGVVAAAEGAGALGSLGIAAGAAVGTAGGAVGAVGVAVAKAVGKL